MEILFDGIEAGAGRLGSWLFGVAALLHLECGRLWGFLAVPFRAPAGLSKVIVGSSALSVEREFVFVFLCALIFSAREFFSLWQAVDDACDTVLDSRQTKIKNEACLESRQNQMSAQVPGMDGMVPFHLVSSRH